MWGSKQHVAFGVQCAMFDSPKASIGYEVKRDRRYLRSKPNSCLHINDYMAMRILVYCSQGGKAPGPQPQNGPTDATDCGSDPHLMAWGGQSRASCDQASCIGMQKGCHKRNLNFNSSLKRKKTSTTVASRRPISTVCTDSPSRDMKTPSRPGRQTQT